MDPLGRSAPRTVERVSVATVDYRADTAPESSRTEYWLDVIGRTFGGIHLDMPGGFEAGDRLRVGEFGAVRVAELSISKASAAERNRRHIARSDTDLFKIDVQVRGPLVVEHNGREVTQWPGDFTFVDLSRPARRRHPKSKVVAVIFPRSLLPVHADELLRVGGARVDGDRGMAALVSSLARQLPDHLHDVDGASRVRLGSAIVDLVNALVTERVGRTATVAPETHQRALLLRIYAYIEAELGSSELSPRTIAAANFISVRALHKAFESEQTSVGDHVRRRRLERSRADLLDPAHHREPVSRIGARWGSGPRRSSAGHSARPTGSRRPSTAPSHTPTLAELSGMREVHVPHSCCCSHGRHFAGADAWRDLAALVHRGLGVQDFSLAAARALRHAVPFDGVCVLTLDPATLLPTGEVVENGLPAARWRG